MAHFAELSNNNIVKRVIVVDNYNILNQLGVESEDVGIQFCKSLYGADTIWLQTSYNAAFRKNFAGIDFTYDSELDAFIPPKLYSSWVLNETICQWEPPIPYPTDDKQYEWDDNTQSWVEI
jgi:hypothetical protein